MPSIVLSENSMNLPQPVVSKQASSGPRDMTSLKDILPLPEGIAASLAASIVGSAAVMHAYKSIGIDDGTARALLTAALVPPRKPNVEEAGAQAVPGVGNEGPCKEFMHTAALLSMKSGGDDKDFLEGPPSGIRAAMLAAAATNSDAQNAAAMLTVANAAKTAASVVSHLPAESGVAAFAGALSIEKGAMTSPPALGSVEVEQALPYASTAGLPRELRSGSYSAGRESDEIATLSQSKELTGIEMLRQLMEQNKAKNDADNSVRNMGGYAMASMTSRAAEKLPAKAPVTMRWTTAAATAPAAFEEAGDDGVGHIAEDQQHANAISEDVQKEGAEEMEVVERVNGQEGCRKLYLGNIPKGIGEGLIMSECRKFGSVTSSFYKQDAGNLFDGSWALITFGTSEQASAAVSRLSQRVNLFGSEQLIEVRFGQPEDDSRVERMSEDTRTNLGGASTIDGPWPYTVRDGSKRDRSRSRDRVRGRMGREGGRARSRSRQRRRHRQRSHSRGRRRGSEESSASGEDATAAPATTAVASGVAASVEQRKVRGLGGFDAAPSLAGDASGALVAAGGLGSGEMLGGGRQVGVRGSWAEFATSAGRSYYVNVVSGEKTWTRPAGYDNMAASRRAAPGGVVAGQSGVSAHSNVYIGNLPPGSNDVAFRQLFSPFGTVVSIKVVPEMHYGFVKFSNLHEAQRAIDATNGALFNGSELAVRFANKDRF
eukprot:TRINITY_DN26817_c0_g1_i1.p1 TRINITY_DN26817_c0_g1~~TRINITY_DN26817_c0_g1_i1.p1  ORF type:complete len:714 (-),score=108.33 TRINITY_DN26817_c0_g1_i1:60-2201(-)